MSVNKQGSPGSGRRASSCPRSAWLRVLCPAIIASSSIFRCTHALRWGGGLLNGETPKWANVMSVIGEIREGQQESAIRPARDNTATFGLRQANRQLSEVVYRPDGSEADPEEDYFDSIRFLERWVPLDGERPLFHRKTDLHWHDMCAESLGMPKVALMFLTRGPIHTEPLWEMWMKEAEGKVLLPCTEGYPCDMTDEELQAALKACKLERSIHHSPIKRQHMFRVYTHTADPEFLGFQPGSVFQNSVVKNLLPPGVYYYQYELVEGVRSMLSAALEDRLNQRFVILCESCMPLYPPTMLYMQFLHEAKSRVVMDGFIETNTSISHDWHDEMHIKYGIHRLHHWKKGNQRNTLTRAHAELAVADTRLSVALSKDCWKCQVEERFFATLLAYNGKSHEAYLHPALVYEDWSRMTGGGHPHDWEPEEVHTGLLRFAREHHACTASESVGPLESAEALFDSYSEETESWPSATARPPFQRLTAECAMVMRKFKPPTISEALALYQSPSFRNWDYAGSYCENYNCTTFSNQPQ